MNTPITYLITTGELTPGNFGQKKIEILKTVEAALRARISMIQIREKQITAKQLFDLARECSLIVAGSKTKLLVNGRADIAKAAGVDGVHLPEEGIPVRDIRRAFPLPFLIAASVHSMRSAKAAENDGADLVVYGPVFDSGEKAGKGIDELKHVCRELGEFPVIAVGGIGDTNVGDVLQAGAAGCAAIRYLNENVHREQRKTQGTQKSR